MFLAVMVVFLVCWLPWWIFIIISPFNDMFKDYGGPWTPYNIFTWLGVNGSIE